MLLGILRKLNWVDAFVIIAFVRICYVSFKTGFTIELFKLLGVILSTYISMHYFTIVSDLVIRKGATTGKVPIEFTDFISFLLLSIAGYLVFLFLRSVFYRFMKIEAAPNLQKWGGLILGILRAFLFNSLVIFILVISSFQYTKESVSNSYCGSSIFRLAPATYTWLWKNAASKFMNNEKFNKTINEVQHDFAKK